MIMEFSGQDNIMIDAQFEELRTASLKRCPNKWEYEQVLKAFDFARKAHEGVRRRSGVPYILHPIAVAKIVVNEIGLGYKSICSALLHDVVEDTDYTVEDIRRLFGDKIASLVDGLTKMKYALDNDGKNLRENTESLQAENFKRILLTLNDDIRVMLIKLADRLHNLRTIEYMPEAKRDKILAETSYIFIPLAHRMGMYNIKTEMENIWLQYKEPKANREIRQRLQDISEARQPIMENFVNPIDRMMRDTRLKYTIQTRMKTPYSIWRKMNVKKVPFEEIYDIYAVRIIFEPEDGANEHEQCYRIYRMLQSVYPKREKLDRHRDFLATPKANGYEALHCTMMVPGGYWVEVQIRTKRMNDVAERGVAAHWSYKNGSQQSTDREDQSIDLWLAKIQKVLQNQDASALDLLDDIHEELTTGEIYVFTPKGESKSLPKGYTALDFAYQIHSKIGNRAIAARINQKLMPLSTVLQSGDQVLIITTETQKPERDWLKFVKSSKAREKISDFLKEEGKGNIAEGNRILDSRLAELGVRPNSRVLKKLMNAYSVSGGKDDLYMKVAMGVIDLSDLDNVIHYNSRQKAVSLWGVTVDEENGVEDAGEVVEGVEATSFIISDCCQPMPGDAITGFLYENGSVVLHKKSCQVAESLASKKGNTIVKVSWKKHKVVSFLARISIRGIDRIGIVNEITREVSYDFNLNMRQMFFQTHDAIFDGYIDLYVHDTSHLDSIVKRILLIKGVEMAQRTEVTD